MGGGGREREREGKRCGQRSGEIDGASWLNGRGQETSLSKKRLIAVVSWIANGYY
jgi:hypothetical protein